MQLGYGLILATQFSHRTSKTDGLPTSILAYGAFNTTDALPAVAVRGTLAATDHPKAATADPKMFFDNRFLQELESSGFVKELYGNK